MLITDLFPSNFLKAADLGGQIREATIEGLTQEQLNDGQAKPVLRFVGIPKGLILNRTNAVSLATLLGPETNAWAGKQIRLFTTPVQYQGRVVDSIRVSVGSAGTQPAQNNIFDNAAQTSAPPAAPSVTNEAQPVASPPPVEQALDWDV